MNQESYRVLVTGSRDWPDAEQVRRELDTELLNVVDSGDDVLTVIHGNCPTGADSQAGMWAKERIAQGYPVEVEHHPADWDQFGKRAGFIRNEKMVSLGANVCLAFVYNGSNGASHTRDLAKRAGIPTQEYIKNGTNMATQIDRTPILKPRPYIRVNDEVTFRDIPIMWRNFQGEERMFNAAGKRNFAIPLEADVALELWEKGWNVKEKVQEDGTHLFHLPVTVKMDGQRPPRMFLITMSQMKRVQLNEDTVILADWAEFDRVDVTLRPFNWDIQGKKGVSAYLKEFMGTLHESPLELEYAHIPIEGEERAKEVLELENIIDAQVEADSGWQQGFDEDGGQKSIAAA